MAVQSLELEIRDNADQASESIQYFTNSLFRLSTQAYFTNRRLGELVNNLRQINGLAGQASGLGQMITYLKDISQGMHAMYQAVININNAINFQTRVLYDAITALGKYMSATGGASKGADVFGNSANDAAKKSHEMAAGMEEVERTTESTRQAFSEFGNSAKGSGLGEAMEELEETTESTKESFEAIKTSIDAANGKTSEFYRSMKESFGITSDGTKETNAFKDAMDRLGNSMKGVRQRFHGLFSSFTRVLKFRIFRTIIREIADAFSEGLKNVREYSKAIHGLYAQDMDRLDNELLKMKNSLGAALAPAIQALLPLLRTLINYLIQAANAFNQFMALMNGRGQWTKAIDVVASDFEDAKKAATGAAKAAKGLLASWDELNIIQSEAGGGSGTGGTKVTTDYTKMFEESFQFEGWIRDLVNFLQEHLPIVHGLLAGILGMFLGISDLGTLFVTIGLITTFENTGDIAKNGFTKSNIATGLIAALESGLGGLFTGFTIGGMTTGLLGLVTGFSISAGIQLVAGFDFYFSREEFDKAIGAGLLAIIAFGMAGSSITKAAGIGSMAEGFFLGATIGLEILMISSFRMSYKEDDVLGAILSGFGVVAAAAAGGYAWGTQFGFKPQCTIIGATIGAAILLSMMFSASYEDGAIEAAIVSALGLVGTGAALGWMLGRMFGVSDFVGVMTGLGIGVAVTLGIKLLTDFDKGTVIDVLVDTLGLIAGAAFAGGALGSAFGHPVIGALVGLSIGAVATVVLKLINTAKQGDITDVIKEGLHLVGAGAIGGLVGGVAGLFAGHPVIGAMVGFAIGAVADLVLKLVLPQEQAKQQILVTDQELDDLVASHFFKSDVRATLNLIDMSIENVSLARQKIAETLGNMTIIMRNIHFGINKQENYESLKTQIFGTGNNDGLINKIVTYAKEQTTQLETNFSLVPLWVNGEDKSADALLFGVQGWAGIESDVRDIGKRISDELSKGFTNGIANFDEEAVGAMTKELMELSQAMTQATVISNATNGLLLNITSGKMSVAEAFAAYSDELYAGLLSSELASATSYRSMEATYRKKAELYPEDAEQWLKLAEEAKYWADLIESTAVANAQSTRDAQIEPAYRIIRQNAQVPEGYDVAIPAGMTAAAYKGLHSDQSGLYSSILRQVLDDLYGKDNTNAFIKAGMNLENLLPDDVRTAFNAAMIDLFVRGLWNGTGAPEGLISEETKVAKELEPFKEAFEGVVALQNQHGWSGKDALDYFASQYDDGFTDYQLAYMKSTEWWAENFGEADIEGPLNVTAPEVNVATPPGGYSTDDEDDEKENAELVTQTGILRQIQTLAQQIYNAKTSQQISVSARLGWVVEQSMKEWNRLNGRTGTGVAGATDLGP